MTTLVLLISSQRPLSYLPALLSLQMRAILVDWMAEVHNAIFLSPPALFNAVNIFDRFAIMSNLRSSEKDWLFTNLQVTKSPNEA